MLKAKNSIGRSLILIVPFIGSGFFIIGVPVWLILQNRILEASLVLIAWGVGQLVGGLLLNYSPLKAFRYNVTFGRIIAVLILINGGAIVFLTLNSLSFFLIFACVCISGAGWSVFQVTKRNITGLWGEKWVRLAGGLGRIGAALSAVLYPVIILTSENLWVAGFLLVSLFISPLFFIKAKMDTPPIVKKSTIEKMTPLFDNFFLVFTTYGLIATYVIIVSLTVNVEWVSAFMPLYMLGAIIAPVIATKTFHFFKQNYAGWIILNSIANTIWLTLFIHPLFVLIVGFVNGILFFIVEGSSDWASYVKDETSELVLGRAFGSTLVTIIMASIVASFETNPMLIVVTYLGLGFILSLGYIFYRYKRLGTLQV